MLSKTVEHRMCCEWSGHMLSVSDVSWRHEVTWLASQNVMVLHDVTSWCHVTWCRIADVVGRHSVTGHHCVAWRHGVMWYHVASWCDQEPWHDTTVTSTCHCAMSWHDVMVSRDIAVLHGSFFWQVFVTGLRDGSSWRFFMTISHRNWLIKKHFLLKLGVNWLHSRWAKCFSKTYWR